MCFNNVSSALKYSTGIISTYFLNSLWTFDWFWWSLGSLFNHAFLGCFSQRSCQLPPIQNLGSCPYNPLDAKDSNWWQYLCNFQNTAPLTVSSSFTWRTLLQLFSIHFSAIVQHIFCTVHSYILVFFSGHSKYVSIYGKKTFFHNGLILHPRKRHARQFWLPLKRLKNPGTNSFYTRKFIRNIRFQLGANKSRIGSPAWRQSHDANKQRKTSLVPPIKN